MLGSGPNRIGQGIEFDYCCVHAAQAFRRLGYEAVLLNSNPETVSTDYDTSDRLYLEPLTLERVLDVCELEQPLGVVVSLGGQTPLRLAPGARRGRRAAARRPARRDRRRRGPRRASPRSLGELGLARRVGRGRRRARRRARSPSGSATRCSSARTTSSAAAACASRATADELDVDEPCLVDRFLEGAIELDVDVLCDGDGGWVAAILEHVEPAGVHSGDSACVFPAPVGDGGARGGDPRCRRTRSRAASARAGSSTSSSRCTSGRLYVLEANPRASRTVPFVAKATGVPLVEHACRLLLGEPLAELDLPERALADARVGEGGDLPRATASPAPPTAARRCARPAR